MAKVVFGVSSGEWAKHLRPYLKRKFWRKVRRKGQIDIRKETQ